MKQDSDEPVRRISRAAQGADIRNSLFPIRDELPNFRQYLNIVERTLLCSMLIRAGNQRKAAVLLGLPRRSLEKRLDSLGLTHLGQHIIELANLTIPTPQGLAEQLYAAAVQPQGFTPLPTDSGMDFNSRSSETPTQSEDMCGDPKSSVKDL